MKKITLFTSLLSALIFIAFLSVSLFSQTANSKWKRLSGQWDITNSTAVQSQPKAIIWNSYEILNYNTITTLQPLNQYDSFEIKSTLFDRYESPSQFMISFAVTSESQSWYYHMYAFKFTGGFWGMNRVSFIFSDRLDKTKPFPTKNNTFVKELASAECKIKYGKIQTYRVEFKDSTVILYVDGQKILSAPFPEKTYDGLLAISSLNIKLAVDKVEVRQGEKPVFEDDFNEDSIYVRRLQVEKVPANKEKKVEEKQL